MQDLFLLHFLDLFQVLRDEVLFTSQKVFVFVLYVWKVFKDHPISIITHVYNKELVVTLLFYKFTKSWPDRIYIA